MSDAQNQFWDKLFKILFLRIPAVCSGRSEGRLSAHGVHRTHSWGLRSTRGIVYLLSTNETS